jgi:UDP-GlcNAc3NAcA epimerase
MNGNRKIKVITILGARPQFVKAAAVSKAFSEYEDLQVAEEILHTGQHYDDNMSEIFFREFSLPRPAVNLNIGGGLHGQSTGKMLAAIEKELKERKPDRVLVYGDTNSTIAGALAAAKLHIPVDHVEAGLRSFNRKMPEEINRVLTDHLCDLFFVPSDEAKSNLASEGITDRVHVVGDVMVDVMRATLPLAERRSQILQEVGVLPKQYALVTLHRASNTDDSKCFASILSGLKAIAQKIPLVFPVHPRTKPLLLAAFDSDLSLGKKEGILFIEPVGYLDMVKLEAHARVILTDSGGVQKEACWVGTPCITLRAETEWTETLVHGFNLLAGSDTSRIQEAFNAMYDLEIEPGELYGDGNAAKRIVKIIADQHR